MELGVQAYRRFGVDRKAEEKTAQAKREFHEGVAEYAKADPAFKKARPAQQKLDRRGCHAKKLNRLFT